MSEKQITEELNRFKQAANIMVDKGRVTKLEANTRILDKAKSLGVVPQDYFPEKVSPLVRLPLEVGASVVSSFTPAPLITSTLGYGAANYAITKAGDLINPDLPSKSNVDQLTESVFNTAIMGSFNLATKGAGSVISTAYKAFKEPTKAGIEAAKKGAEKVVTTSKTELQKAGLDSTLASRIAGNLAPDEQSATIFVQKGLKDTITKQAKKEGLSLKEYYKKYNLKPEGFQLPIGMTGGGFVAGAFNALGRMPLIGKPIQAQIEAIRKSMLHYTETAFSPAKKMTELESSEMIAKVGKRKFENMSARARSLYKKSDAGFSTLFKNNVISTAELSKVVQGILKGKDLKGANLDKTFIKYLADDVLPQLKSKKIDYKTLENINFGLKDFYRSAYAGTISQSGAKTTTEKLSQNLIQSIEKGILTKQYGSNVLKLQGQAAKDWDKAVGLRQQAHENWAKMMGTAQGIMPKLIADKIGAKGLRVTGSPSKDFQTKGILDETGKLEGLFSAAFSGKSPEKLKQLKKLLKSSSTKKKTATGKQDVNWRFNLLAANHFDTIMMKELVEDVAGQRVLKSNFNPQALKEMLGLNRKGSNDYKFTKMLLEGFPNVTPKKLEGFLNALEVMPNAAMSISTFMQRSTMLRAIGGLTPMTLIGTTGASAFAGAGIGGMMVGMGAMYGISKFLSLPATKKLADLAAKSGKSGEVYQKLLGQRMAKYFEDLNKKFGTLPSGKELPTVVRPAVTIPITEQITDNQE
tara:strand:- start:8293 stop:10542 length:2250 start_codon:yes stop_codon:yes gene_type:complete